MYLYRVKKQFKYGFLLGVFTLLAVVLVTVKQLQSLTYNKEIDHSTLHGQIVHDQKSSFATFGDSFNLNLEKINGLEKDVKNLGKSVAHFHDINLSDFLDEKVGITYSSRKVYRKFRKEDLLFPFQYFW